VGPAAAPAAAPGSAFVVLDALRAHLDGVEWAPLRLASGRPVRAASPRLPHALALHLAHAARATADGLVVPDLPHLAALVGADVPQLAGALEALTRGGVVLPAGATGSPVRLAPAVLGPAAPRGAALDWDAVAVATAGSPSAWIAAHALAERLERYRWTPVPRADLEQALGAGASGARGALDRLVAGGVVARREQRGGVSVYQFEDALWQAGSAPVLGGVGGGRTAPAPAPQTAEHAVAQHAGATRASPGAGPGAAPAPGLRLVVGGVEVEVPAGLRARVELGADGRPTLTLLPGA
jgi:hypothetical protein